MEHSQGSFHIQQKNEIISKTELSTEKERIKSPNNENHQNGVSYINYIPQKQLDIDSIKEEMEDEPVTEMIFKNSNNEIVNVETLFKEFETIMYYEDEKIMI